MYDENCNGEALFVLFYYFNNESGNFVNVLESGEQSFILVGDKFNAPTGTTAFVLIFSFPLLHWADIFCFFIEFDVEKSERT